MLTSAGFQNLPLLQHLSRSWRQRLLAAAKLERYAKDQVLFQQDQPAEHLWLLYDGWVHLVTSPVGHSPREGLVVATVTPDDGFCGFSALEQRSYSVSAVAATACEVLRFPAPLVQAALQREPHFAYDVLCHCARRLRHASDQYAVMAQPVTHRLIATILRLQRQFGRTLPVTHRELAQMACTTTESAIRTVRRLKRQGYVEGRRGVLEIRQARPLEQLLQRNGHGAEERLDEQRT